MDLGTTTDYRADYSLALPPLPYLLSEYSFAIDCISLESGTDTEYEHALLRVQSASGKYDQLRIPEYLDSPCEMGQFPWNR